MQLTKNTLYKRICNLKSKKKLFVIFGFLSFLIVGSLSLFFIFGSNKSDKDIFIEKSEEEKAQKEDKIIVNENILRKDLYPDMYVQGGPVVEEVDKAKTAYLTFDDGPSQRTVEIMDILEKYNIKATFFVTGHMPGEKSMAILKQIVDRGHVIGVHTWTHNYKKIYANLENYLEDFYLIYEYIYKSTGIKPEIYRFPGGSVNSFNRKIYKDIMNEMASRGFKYYDWNKSNNDSVGVKNVDTLYKNSVSGISSLDKVILLCHDNSDKKATVASLDRVLHKMIQEGFSFSVITRKVKPIAMSFK